MPKTQRQDWIVAQHRTLLIVFIHSATVVFTASKFVVFAISQIAEPKYQAFLHSK